MEPLREGDPRQVGPYRLTGRLGAGGMGQVFSGVSPGGRKVAVKLIRAEHASSPQFRARFAQEVQAAQRVGGFHTAPVVDADPDAATPWLVTAFIPGTSLHQVVSGQGPLELGAVRELGAGLAEGLAAIHACGVVHRDLKPGNVILAEDGPRIIDFGIARPADANSLTSAGVVIGTFAYMSPEQVGGERAGPASDVFSLGCVLTFAATGKGPFDAATIPAIVHRIINKEPCLDGITGELRKLVGGCLAKTPASRPGVEEILTRLAPRAAPILNAPAARTQTTPPASRPVTEGSPATTPPARPPAPAATPTRPLADDSGAGAADATHTAGPRSTPFVRRALILGALGAAALAAIYYTNISEWRSAKHIATLTGHTGHVYSVAFSPDGNTLATGAGGPLLATGDETVRLWDVATRRSTAPLTGRTGSVYSVAFSPDGNTLATGGLPVRLWDVAARRRTATLTGHTSTGGSSVAFSPNGKTLATGDGETARLWDVATRRRTATLTGHGGSSVAFSPNGKTLATGDGETVRLWDVATRRRTATLTSDVHAVLSVAFSPNGKTLATGNNDSTVRLWDVATRRNTATLTGHANAVRSVAFSPNGKTLATGSDDATVRLWKIRRSVFSV